MNRKDEIQYAVDIVKNGGIIAYPTEAVFGLGCDPFNEHAVNRLLAIKQRASEKGLILIGANWTVLAPLVQTIEPSVLARTQATWPGPFTWIFPTSEQTPSWLCGPDHTIALRITAHPIAHALCCALNAPLISTSANFSGHSPLRDAKSVRCIFGQKIDFVVSGSLGAETQPTQIRDALSGKILRQ